MKFSPIKNANPSFHSHRFVYSKLSFHQGPAGVPATLSILVRSWPTSLHCYSVFSYVLCGLSNSMTKLTEIRQRATSGVCLERRQEELLLVRGSATRLGRESNRTNGKRSWSWCLNIPTMPCYGGKEWWSQKIGKPSICSQNALHLHSALGFANLPTHHLI